METGSHHMRHIDVADRLQGGMAPSEGGYDLERHMRHIDVADRMGGMAPSASTGGSPRNSVDISRNGAPQTGSSALMPVASRSAAAATAVSQFARAAAAEGLPPAQCAALGLQQPALAPLR